MKVEKGVATVPYKICDGEKKYVLLKREKNWQGWEMPKGHMEGEGYTHTALVELKEEAGINSEDVLGLNNINEKGQECIITWTYRENGTLRKSEFKAILVKLSSDTELDISNNPHSEHGKAKFASFSEALDLLTHEEQKKILKLSREQYR